MSLIFPTQAADITTANSPMLLVLDAVSDAVPDEVPDAVWMEYRTSYWMEKCHAIFPCDTQIMH
jgi:hypothetical protein